ncbi:MAG: hypothetical protein KGK07_09950 [Chloroflexota bacterium]|nr:hypothetical protein [Chloroflexota bacterium]
MDIRFCTTSDGIRIAYSVSGKAGGPPVIWIPEWVSHLELSEELPSYRAGYDALRNQFRLIRYDKRGTGLSDRGMTDFTIDPACAISKRSWGT